MDPWERSSPLSVGAIILAAESEMSLGDMFIGMFIPGLFMAGLYILYIIITCTLNPEAGSKIPHPDDSLSFHDKLKVTAKALLPPLILIIVVLGSIMIGVAVPTEVAAVGAIGTIVMTVCNSIFTLSVMLDAMIKTLSVTAMILTIVVGGTMFASVFLSSGGFDAVRGILEFWDLDKWGTLILI